MLFTTFRTSASHDTSSGAASARPPRCRMAAATSSALRVLMSATTANAPSAASCPHKARPRPEAPPVTRATRLASLFIGVVNRQPPERTVSFFPTGIVHFDDGWSFAFESCSRKSFPRIYDQSAANGEKIPGSLVGLTKGTWREFPEFSEALLPVHVGSVDGPSILAILRIGRNIQIHVGGAKQIRVSPSVRTEKPSANLSCNGGPDAWSVQRFDGHTHAMISSGRVKGKNRSVRLAEFKSKASG